MLNKNIFLKLETIAKDLIINYEYPYEILPNIKDFILKKGNELNNDFIKKDENIWIHKTAKVNILLRGSPVPA